MTSDAVPAVTHVPEIWCDGSCGGRCSECARLRALPRREFMAWFAHKYGERFCDRNPDHLTGSYAHKVECR